MAVVVKWKDGVKVYNNPSPRLMSEIVHYPHLECDVSHMLHLPLDRWDICRGQLIDKENTGVIDRIVTVNNHLNWHEKVFLVALAIGSICLIAVLLYLID